MYRLTFSKIFSTALLCVLITHILPVNSVSYLVVFDPSKMYLPCKNLGLDPLDKYLDLSNLTTEQVTDHSVNVWGTFRLVNDISNGIVNVSYKIFIQK